MSDLSRHVATFYTPAGDHQPLGPDNTAIRWSDDRSRTDSSRPSRRRRRGNSMGTREKKRSVTAKIKSRMRKIYRYSLKQFNKLNWWQKIVAGFFIFTTITAAILVTVFHTELLAMMLPVAKQLTDWPAGWMIIWALCYVSAFPPMFGYSTSISLAGFIYGFPNGWFMVASATLLGSTSAFLACRYCFRNFAQRMVATDKRFAALTLTLKHDGLKLLCMIRLCPLPYSISNGALSTFPTVSPLSFMIATAVSTPKLLIHIFIGTRLRMLAEEGRRMDTKTKLVNYGSLIGGVTLGAVTGWLIYKRTVARAKQLEQEERAHLRSNRTSISSGRLSSEVMRNAGYTDASSDDEINHSRDPRAARVASLIGALMEGDELAEAALFSDDTRDESDLEFQQTARVYEEELLDVTRGSNDQT